MTRGHKVAVVFDLDGTLVDTMTSAPLAYADTIRALGGPEVSPSDAFRRRLDAVHGSPGRVDAGRVRGLRALEVDGSVADIDGVGHAGTQSQAAQLEPVRGGLRPAHLVASDDYREVSAETGGREHARCGSARGGGEDAEPVAAHAQCVEHLDYSGKWFDAGDDGGEIAVKALDVGR